MINGLAEAIEQQYFSARDVAGGAVGSSSMPETPLGLNGPAGPSVPITEWIPVQAMKEPEAFAEHSIYKSKEATVWAEYLAATRRIAELEAEKVLSEKQAGEWKVEAFARYRDIRMLSAENDALKAQVAAFTASSPPASDTPLPERRPDGTLRPVSKPWSASVPDGGPRRVGG